MSTEALNWAFRQTMAPTAKLVLIVLADHADQAHSCFPSVGRIAERASLGRSTVQDQLRKLEELGFIRTVRRVRGNGSDTSSRYYLAAPNPQADDAEEGARELGGGGPGAGHPPARELGPQNHHLEPSPEETLPTTSPSGIEGLFEKAWSQWPNKNSKAKALAKFVKLAEGDGSKAHRLATRIIEYGQAYARSGRETKFVPYLVTWLNHERWTDPLPQPEQSRDQQRVASIASVVDHFRGQ